jgi:hypothetical protein
MTKNCDSHTPSRRNRSERTLTRSFSLFLAVITAAGILHAPHGDAQVLCVGEDGHFAIEQAVDGVCLSQAAGSSAHDNPVVTHNCASTGDHCGECDDTPLGYHEEIVARFLRKGSLKTFSPHPIFSQSSSGQSLALGRYAPSVATPTRIYSHHLSSLRSVSLQR